MLSLASSRPNSPLPLSMWIGFFQNSCKTAILLSKSVRSLFSDLLFSRIECFPEHYSVNYLSATSHINRIVKLIPKFKKVRHARAHAISDPLLFHLYYQFACVFNVSDLPS